MASVEEIVARARVRIRELGHKNYKKFLVAKCKLNETYLDQLKNPETEALQKLASGLQLSVSELTKDRPPTPSEKKMLAYLGARKKGQRSTAPRLAAAAKRPRNVTVEIGELDVELSAGDGANIEDEPPIDVWRFPSSLVQRLGVDEEQVKIVRVRGDSMSPTLSDGDHVMIDLQVRSDAPPDGIYALSEGVGGAFVKRIQFVKSAKGKPMVLIISDNKDYPVREVELRPPFRIIGRVVWSSHMVR